MKNIHSLLKRLRTITIPSMVLGTLCTVGAFFIGIRTAGDVQPFTTSEAALEAFVTGSVPGDLNGNGMHDIADAIGILEFAEQLETPTPEEIRRGDADGDFRLTVKDALRVLRTVSLR